MIHILYLYLLEIINDRLHQTTAKKATDAKSNELQTRHGLTQILQKLSFIFPAIVGEKQGRDSWGKEWRREGRELRKTDILPLKNRRKPSNLPLSFK